MAIIYRRLGRSGPEVAPLALGGNVFGWTADESTSFKLLSKFVSSGFNLIDTADVYSRWKQGNSGGESELVIGKWQKQTGNREKVVIATKVGMEMGPGKKGLTRSYIMQAVEDSLRRLQTDYIDLYQAHRDDHDTPLEETLQAFTRLIEQGKVRAVGASNYAADRLHTALQISQQSGHASFVSLQPMYNLYDREEFESKLEAECTENALGVISYFSLASGFLTGKYRSEGDLSKSARGNRVSKYLNDRGYRILQALDAVAKEQESTSASVALAWLMARPSITAPIASATSLEQLDALIAAADLKLSRPQIELLNQASDWDIKK